MTKKIKLLIVLSLSISFLTFANATDLKAAFKAARASKKVIELPTGYLKVVDPSTADLAKKINAQRKSFYEKIAKKNGTSVEQVGLQAAKKIQDKLKNK